MGILEIFNYKQTESTPCGEVSVDLSRLDELKSNGWIVKVERDFVHFIGVQSEVMGMFGFCGFPDHLTVCDSMEVDETVYFDSKESLNSFLMIINETIKLDKSITLI